VGGGVDQQSSTTNPNDKTRGPAVDVESVARPQDCDAELRGFEAGAPVVGKLGRGEGLKLYLFDLSVTLEAISIAG